MKDYEKLSNGQLAEVLRLPDSHCSPENRIFAISEALARVINKLL